MEIKWLVWNNRILLKITQTYNCRMKRKVKRTVLKGISLKVWQSIAGFVLAPGIACAYDSYVIDEQTFDYSFEPFSEQQADAVIIDAGSDDSYAGLPSLDDAWEPNLAIDDQPTASQPQDPTSIAPLIPWDPRVTQSILPIEQPLSTSTASASANKLQGVQAKVLTPSGSEQIALELPKMPSPVKGEHPDSKGVLPSEKAPAGSLPFGANTLVTPQSLIVQNNGQDNLAGQLGNLTQNPQSILINFNNVGMIEFIRFVSRISNRNFIFNDADLQFNVTIVSEDPTTIENVLTALFQELRIHSLFVLEQDNNFIIHTNAAVQGISEVVAEGLPVTENQRNAQIVTEVFRLNTLVPSRASNIIRPLLSDVALVEAVDETSQLIVTDLAQNILKIGQLLKSLDSPLSGLVIGQYLVLNTFPDTLIALAEKIMAPIAEGKPLVFVPHTPSNSIFIVSNPFLVERTIAVLSNLDINVGATRIFSPEALRFVSPNNPFSQEKPGQTTQYGLPGTGISPGIAPGATGYGGYPGAPGVGGVGGLPPAPGGAPGLPAGALYGPNGEILLPGQPGYPGTRGGTGGQIPGYPQQLPGQISPAGGAVPPNLPYQPGHPITPGQRAFLKELPPGHIARTQFAIYKLRYRKGNQIQTALNNIATSLSSGNNTNQELIQSLTSIQYIETTNSLVFSGTVETIDKVLELISQLDVPLRQVFIEVLVLDTTLTDSLTYGVNWQARYSDPNAAGAESFLTSNPLTAALDAALPGLQPDASSLTTQNGFTMGLIGRTISHNGTEFATIAGFVEAIHMRSSANIIMNPKVIAEDNTTAEILSVSIPHSKPHPSQTTVVTSSPLTSTLGMWNTVKSDPSFEQY